MNLLKLLEKKLSQTTINTWFSEAEAIAFENNNLYIAVPNTFNKQMIESRYLSDLNECLLDMFSSDVHAVIYTTEEASAMTSGDIKTDDDNEFTFERFVVGPSNRFAHAAAMAVSEKPAYRYNPLYIYGDSGLGKTHLLRAIANVIRKNKPNAKIVYITGEDFTIELIAALRIGKMEEFRVKYRQADLLLIDDIQFIAGKKQTEEEFFYTFNELYNNHIQIVMTADRPPKEMYNLENRIRSRFEAGLLADIQVPDYETRMAIVKNKAELLGLDLPDSLSQYIATSIKANIRQIEGTVRKLMAKKNLLRQKIDIDLVNEAIKEVLHDDPEIMVTPTLIINEVAKFYGIEPDTIRSVSRKKETLIPRQVAMYIIREKTGLSLPEIGREFGKDHTTVMNAINKVETMMKKEPEFKTLIKDLSTNISSKG
ncbi:MAG: chromosomal replication initiator protein DnaA [Clostridia bacterium]|nr:chromosomal replication initiator protein DnaA [Clostridia bacterium]